MQKAAPFLIVFLILCILPNADAFDPMRIQIRTVLPKEIKTVGAAAQYYAVVIDYRVATQYPAPEESSRIAAEQISPLFFTNSVLAVDDAILALLRKPYVLIIDHEHKLFSFAKGADQ